MAENTYNTTSTNAQLSQPIEVEYSSIISSYIPYFNELSDTGKKRFLERTIHFRNLKKFNYVGMEEKKEVPILISAAAVQITFGFDKYELPFFKNPAGPKKNMPGLYGTLCDVLNQDPLTVNKILLK